MRSNLRSWPRNCCSDVLASAGGRLRAPVRRGSCSLVATGVAACAEASPIASRSATTVMRSSVPLGTYWLMQQTAPPWSVP